MSETLMTAKELGTYLRLSCQSIYRLTGEGKIPVLRLGPKTLRFNLDAVISALTLNGDDTDD